MCGRPKQSHTCFWSSLAFQSQPEPHSASVGLHCSAGELVAQRPQAKHHQNQPPLTMIEMVADKA